MTFSRRSEVVWAFRPTAKQFNLKLSFAAPALRRVWYGDDHSSEHDL